MKFFCFWIHNKFLKSLAEKSIFAQHPPFDSAQGEANFFHGERDRTMNSRIAGLFGQVSSIYRRPLSFKMACFLSILVHLGIFLFMAFLVTLFEVPDLYTPPLVFDFVFVPVPEYDLSRHALENHKKSLEDQQAMESDRATHPVMRSESTISASDKMAEEKLTIDENSDLPSQELLSPVESSKEKLAYKDENNSSAETHFNSNYVPEEESTTNLNEPFLISKFKLSSLILPRFHMNRPNLIPAKLSVSSKQRKILLKKVKKLAEKLHRIEGADTSFFWKEKGEYYTVKMHHQKAQSTTGLDEVILEVTKQEDGYNLTTEMRMRRLAFSNFAQFVDYWDPYVAVHDDELEGRFHTNNIFTLSTSRGIRPKFHGKVTTAAYKVNSGDSFPFFDYQSVFLGGIETGVKKIHLPKNLFPFIIDTTAAQGRVHTLFEETWITFHRDGSYSWRIASAPKRENCQTLPNEPFFIIGREKAILHVKGVVKGKVLVYSEGKIIIDDDLLYSRHPELSAYADDYLGLVCKKDIEIAHPSVTGPGDLHIYASIFAKRRFRVRHLRGNGEATLYIYGSLSAGSLSATEPRYGTRIRFDKRLGMRRPPNFPMTDRYELIDWDGQWRVKKP